MLLSRPKSNAKLAKSQKYGFITTGLALAPARLSGYEVCASRSPECTRYCLNTAGYAGIFPAVIQGRIEKTKFFFEDRQTFLAQLLRELHNASKTAKRKGKKLACRLNVFSDIQWERIAPELFDLPIQYYDYTKHIARFGRYCEGKLPSNYFLTLSRSEKNEEKCLEFLRNYDRISIAVVFRDMPKKWNGFPVVNGDIHDLRFLQSGVIGLTPKGRLKKAESNFIALEQLKGKTC